MDTNTMIMNLVKLMLNDDHGVDEGVFNYAMMVVESLGMVDEAAWLSANTEATDGRFYLTENIGTIVTLGNKTFFGTSLKECTEMAWAHFMTGDVLLGDEDDCLNCLNAIANAIGVVCKVE